MGIEHDGEGSVEGTLPEVLDDEKLKATIEALLDAHDANLVTLYQLSSIFRPQTAGIISKAFSSPTSVSPFRSPAKMARHITRS